jgi:RimJ/RimL family protein N-acetyltransferase
MLGANCMSNVTVREASPEDAEWFLQHVRALASEPDKKVPLQPDEWVVTPEEQAEMFAAALDGNGDLFLVAEIGGERVGELNLRRGKRAAFRHSLTLGMSVDRRWRNRGVGTVLMQYALGWARDTASVRRIELYVFETNAPAVRLYERHGFAVEGRRKGAVFQDGVLVDDLIMAVYVR